MADKKEGQPSAEEDLGKCQPEEDMVNFWPEEAFDRFGGVEGDLAEPGMVEENEGYCMMHPQ
jgi:hypothetical protein